MITRADRVDKKISPLLRITRDNGVPDSVFLLISSDKKYAHEKKSGGPLCLVAFTNKRSALKYVEHIPHEFGSGWRPISVEIDDLVYTTGLYNDQLIVAVYSGLFDLNCHLDFQRVGK